MTHAKDSADGARWSTAVVTTTALASALNLLLILAVCFYVGPGFERTVAEAKEMRQFAHDAARRNYEAIDKNYELVKDMRENLKETFVVAKRLNTMLDQAEERAKARDTKDKAKGNKDAKDKGKP